MRREGGYPRPGAWCDGPDGLSRALFDSPSSLQGLDGDKKEENSGECARRFSVL